jgi:ribosome biogenesis GTPase / thiamine phosphate phosphatase
MSKRRMIRTDFRKNRSERTRRTDWSELVGSDESEQIAGERVSGKGELTRRRSVRGQAVVPGDDADAGILLDVDETVCRPGRVLSVHGLTSLVQTDEGGFFRCAVRRLLKTISTDKRHVLAVGDRVLFRPVPGSSEGIIERVEPRHGSISRTSRGRQHVLVSNIDRLLIVTSAAEPRLKPNLVDRLLVAAEKGRVEPVIVINKIDLIDPASLQPLVGVYSQMGYQVLQTSATTGFGVQRVKQVLAGRESVVVGQSGVGKSSLLNGVEAGLDLKVLPVSAETEKGCHTTTNARLLPLSFGGYVVDTPGVRQFDLWDVVPAEVAGFYRDVRPYVSLCRFPDCTHTHEADCAVKGAVADGRVDVRRYESYCQVLGGELEN